MIYICVYSGSSPGLLPEYKDAAEALGRALAGAGYGLVYGGSDLGLMGAVAGAVLETGGEAIGVIPENLASRVDHPQLTELHVTGSMHERKEKMFSLSDGFIALPGGLGTLEEIAEVLTWAQLGIHKKPCGLLNIRGYYDYLLDFLTHGVRQRFIREEHLKMIQVAESPGELLEKFRSYKPLNVEKWMDKKHT
jgi:uncharacterized protein (TIGR00730 family)